MPQFLGNVAFLLELALIAGGLVLLHHGRAQGAGLLRAAALVLIVGGLATAVCTTWFWFHYHGQGDFAHAHGARMAPMMPGGRMGMGPGAGGMGPGQMMTPGGGRMRPGGGMGPGGAMPPGGMGPGGMRRPGAAPATPPSPERP